MSLYFHSSYCSPLDCFGWFGTATLTYTASSNHRSANPRRFDLHVVDNSAHPVKPLLQEQSSASYTVRNLLDIQYYNDLLSCRLCLLARGSNTYGIQQRTYHHDCDEQQDPKLDPAQVRPKLAPQRPFVDTR